MKIRSDFVSNSSSSSFIVDKSRHGCWFNQLFNIIYKIGQDNFSTIHVVFDDSVDVANLFLCLEDNISIDDFPRGFTVSKYRDRIHWEDAEDQTFIEVGFTALKAVELIQSNPDFMSHVVKVKVDMGWDNHADEQTYNMLKETGLDFEWSR